MTALDKPSRNKPHSSFSSGAKSRVRLGLSLLFMGAGVTHFVNPEVFLSIMPPWVPYPLEAVYLSGLAEIAGGLMLLTPRSRKWGVLELTLLLVAVFPANVQMLLQADQYSFPAWILWARLPLQPLLIGLIWWSSRESAREG